MKIKLTEHALELFNNIYRYIRLTSVFICVFFSPHSLSQNTFIINTGFSSPISNESQTGFGDLVLTEAFRRLGYKVETVRMPAERALINANLGLDDGDLLRIAGLEKKYPNLIRVPEKVMDMDVMLFTKWKRNFNVAGWHSIKTEPVAIIRGWKVFEKNLVKTINTDNVDQMFTMLTKERADFLGYERWAGLGYIKDNQVKNVVALEPPLVSVPLYTYLHKKHKNLVPKLSRMIKNMKKDGTINKLYSIILLPLMNN